MQILKIKFLTNFFRSLDGTALHKCVNKAQLSPSPDLIHTFVMHGAIFFLCAYALLTHTAYTLALGRPYSSPARLCALRIRSAIYKLCD